MNFFKKLQLALFVLLLPATGRAQRYIGLATSDWSAINSVYLNPATIADCREKMSIGILSLSVLVDNNLGFIPKIPDIGTTLSNSDNVFTKSAAKSFSMLVPAAVVRGPGIMATLSDKISVALTTDIRGINQFNNFDPTLYKALSLTGSVTNQEYHVNTKNFNWTANMWSEIGLSMGAVVAKGYNGRLNAGFTIRRLGGIGYVSITGRNMDIDFAPNADSFYASNSDIEFASNVVRGNSTTLNDITPSGLINKFFGANAGQGLSADAGLTYRYRIGDADKSDYLESNEIHDLILGISVTDFGSIDYFNSTSKAIKVTGNGPLTGKGITGNLGSVDSLASYAIRQGFYVDTATGTRRVYLPTALNISGDVQLYGRFFANLLFIANIANRLNVGNSYYNQVTLTPRYDYHRMTLSLPITYSMLAHDMKLGFCARYTGFFIGSDDAMALLSKHTYGFGIYLGGYVPIFKRYDDPLGLHWGS